MNLAGPKAWNFAARVLKMICAKASLNRRQSALSDWDLLAIQEALPSQRDVAGLELSGHSYPPQYPSPTRGVTAMQR